MPQISVIVPTYERPAQLARAIESVLVQDVDLEVIVVDDASPSALRIESHPRLRVVRLQENGGPAAARNAGADAAQAEWIAFLDSDDVWLPGALRPRLEQACAAVDADNTIWVAGFADQWPHSTSRLRRIPRTARALSDFASGCWTCPGSTALLSRAAWRLSGGQDAQLRRLEDYEWLLRWGLKGGVLSVHPGMAAVIHRGARGGAKEVEAAAAHITAKHKGLPRELRRRMESYLQLELAVSRLYGGAQPAGVAALARSWLLHPRLQPALEQFWS